MILQTLIQNYSTTLGNDPMLVQGAGGNISWKDDNTLWIKASGTWLADANAKPIFTALDLNRVRLLITKDETDFTSAKVENDGLRSSIETSLHALLPQTIVVHVHAIDVIAHAIHLHAKSRLSTILDGLNWAWIDYVKPGLPLTKMIIATLQHRDVPNILILGNHGLVVAGDTIEEVDSTLHSVLSRCQIKPRDIDKTLDINALNQLANDWHDKGYRLPTNTHLHYLSIDPISLAFTENKWVLYPDHAVFLGKHAIFSDEQPTQAPCIFIKKQGIVVHHNITLGQQAMLDCYLNVVLRQANVNDASALNDDEINELLNWDAEKYRQTVNTN